MRKKREPKAFVGETHVKDGFTCFFCDRSKELFYLGDGHRYEVCRSCYSKIQYRSTMPHADLLEYFNTLTSDLKAKASGLRTIVKVPFPKQPWWSNYKNIIIRLNKVGYKVDMFEVFDDGARALLVEYAGLADIYEYTEVERIWGIEKGFGVQMTVISMSRVNV